jgi:hypothetical protein
MDKHDQFAGKNAATARAWEMDMRDKAKAGSEQQKKEPKIGKCDRCGKEKEVKAHRSNETSRTDGATSFGVVTKYYCEECRPQPKKVVQADPKKIKNLLRNAKKGLR